MHMHLDARQTAVAGFVGLANQGPTDEPVLLTKWNEFVHTFGGFHPGTLLPHCVHGWFTNGGGSCFVVRVPDQDGGMPGPYDFVGSRKAGLGALESIEAVTIVAAPDAVGLGNASEYGREGKLHVDFALIVHCESMGNRLAILDPPPGMNAPHILEWRNEVARFDSSYAALYYPWIRVMDPEARRSVLVPPSGHVAGSWARSDRERGVWAAPAKLPLRGVLDVAEGLGHREGEELHRAGINSIRAMPEGIRAWSAQTLSSDSTRAEVATARLSSSVISLVRGATSWASLEPGGPRTWDRVQGDVEAVLQNAWRQGAFVGETAAEAFYVRCNDEVNVPELTAAGRIRVEFGFAPRLPGEFIRMMVEQPAGSWAIYGD
jgi:phage tail sheath protein FI